MLLLALLATGMLAAAERGGKVEHVGGTIAEVPESSKGRLITTGDSHLVFQAGKLLYVVPWKSINLLEYGQQANRRYALAIALSPLLMLSKSRKHFLTIGFHDDGGEQQAMVFQVHKNDIRMLLVSLEAKTNLRVEYQDDDARGAGKGN